MDSNIIDSLNTEKTVTETKYSIRVPDVLKSNIEQCLLTKEETAKLFALAISITDELIYALANGTPTDKITTDVVKRITSILNVDTHEGTSLVPGILALVKEFYNIVATYVGEVHRVYVTDFTRTMVILSIEGIKEQKE